MWKGEKSIRTVGLHWTVILDPRNYWAHVTLSSNHFHEPLPPPSCFSPRVPPSLTLPLAVNCKPVNGVPADSSSLSLSRWSVEYRSSCFILIRRVLKNLIQSIWSWNTNTLFFLMITFMLIDSWLAILTFSRFCYFAILLSVLLFSTWRFGFIIRLFDRYSVEFSFFMTTKLDEFEDLLKNAIVSPLICYSQLSICIDLKLWIVYIRVSL